ncbi:hypothetical protein HYS93_03955 [Candidatus Daviesbacteria bacterium]|nr:hypothetical protein [Candidatus Daviesbacteria bacterium]
MKKIIFIEKTPFMGVELLDMFPSFQIACYYNDNTYSLLKNNGFQIFSYGNNSFRDNIDSDKAIELLLSDKSFLKKIDANFPGSKVIFFYMNDEMASLCKKNKLKLALPPYKIQKRVGDKLFTQKINKILKLNENKTLVIQKSSKKYFDILYLKCEKKLGLPFIIQGRDGVSGSDTFLIRSFEEFKKLIDKMSNKFRASRYIKNLIPISVHLCIKENTVLYDGPFLQIVGFNELSSNPFQFSGNDTNQSLFDQTLKDNIKETSLKIANYLHILKYQGIAGLDFLWDLDTGTIYLQEVNARLVGLTRLLTGIQIEQNKKPHLLSHIECFTSKSIGMVKKQTTSEKNTHYSQIYISNSAKKTNHVTRQLSPGIYQLKNNTLFKTKHSLFLKDMNPNSILITFCVSTQTPLKPDDVAIKLLMKRSVIQPNKYILTDHAKSIIGILRSEVGLTV